MTPNSIFLFPEGAFRFSDALSLYFQHPIIIPPEPLSGHLQLHFRKESALLDPKALLLSNRCVESMSGCHCWSSWAFRKQHWAENYYKHVRLHQNCLVTTLSHAWQLLFYFMWNGKYDLSICFWHINYHTSIVYDNHLNLIRIFKLEAK